jgi:GT2 family glycosyltransferase
MGLTGPLLYLSDITEALSLIFFCVMIHRKVIEKIGFLDDITFPIGAGEDADYCALAQEAGFLIEQVPKTFVSHDPQYWIGGFPIYHVGERTLNSIPNWNETLYWEHREALKRKYAK